MNRKIVIVALVAALALTLSGLAWAHEGCDDCDGECVDYPKRAHMPMLTAEQSDEVKARAAELDEQGASPEEVRTAIAEMLKEWGIQAGAGQRGQQAAPPRWGQQGMDMMQQGHPGMGMMQQGHPGMGMMQQWGQQGPPPQWGQQAAPSRWGQQAGPPGWGQQAAPSRWGQQAGPPRWGQQGPPPQWGQQAGPPGWGQQAGPLRWGQQAGPPGWGQQGPPPQWGQQQQGWRGQQGYYGQQIQHPGWQMMMQRLTPDQREQVKTKITELRENDASAQEIREAIGDMLEDWGIQLSQRPAQNQ